VLPFSQLLGHVGREHLVEQQLHRSSAACPAVQAAWGLGGLALVVGDQLVDLVAIGAVSR
jgi:hypothetical protein